MKNLFKIIGVAVIALATVCLQPAFGNGSPNDFNITNSISAATITSWPTNFTASIFVNTTTNGSVISSNYTSVGVLTGGPVAIGNQESIGLNLQGSVVAAAVSNCIVTVTFVTSMAANGPTVLSDTNGFVTRNDWATTGAGNFSVVIPFTTAVGTNWLNWQTNLSNVTIANAANYIGVYSIVPSMAGGGATINSAHLTVNKKLIPTPLIGQ